MVSLLLKYFPNKAGNEVQFLINKVTPHQQFLRIGYQEVSIYEVQFLIKKCVIRKLQ